MGFRKKIKLGDVVLDPITGMTGTVTARTEFLFGCVRCAVQPKELKDGIPVDAVYVDEPQLERVPKAKPVKPDKKEDPGGDRPDDPGRPTRVEARR